MIRIEKVAAIEELAEFKQEYMNQATASLDGMWLCGFVPLAIHYGFYEDENLIGYCCKNDEGYLLQFFLSPQCQAQGTHLLDSILTKEHADIGEVEGVFVSTASLNFYPSVSIVSQIFRFML